MKVLITGGTGFIGASLCKFLTAQGFSVSVLKREGSDTSVLSSIGESISWYTYSGTYNSVLDAVKQSAPEAVIHLAAAYTYSHKPSDIDRLIDSNIRLGTYLAEAMIQRGVKKMITAGTSFEYYHSHEYNPVNLYAATKQAFENLLDYYVDAENLSVTAVKFFDTYGTEDHRRKLFYAINKALETGEPLALSGGEQVVDYCHIDDVCRALYACLQELDETTPGSKKVYGISGNDRMSLKDLLLLIEKVTGKELPVQLGAREYRDREVMEPWEDFNTPPNWSPEVSLADGLKEIFG